MFRDEISNSVLFSLELMNDILAFCQEQNSKKDREVGRLVYSIYDSLSTVHRGTKPIGTSLEKSLQETIDIYRVETYDDLTVDEFDAFVFNALAICYGYAIGDCDDVEKGKI